MMFRQWSILNAHSVNRGLFVRQRTERTGLHLDREQSFRVKVPIYTISQKSLNCHFRQLCLVSVADIWIITRVRGVHYFDFNVFLIC